MLNHVAVLVRSTVDAAALLAARGLPIGPREVFEGEGTAEIYVGPDDHTSRLLLLEAVAHGPYARALARRGPGLHHLALDVPDLEACVDGLSGSGWYLHPASLRTLRQTRTAWLARPGTRALIELQERAPVSAPPFVTALELPLTAREQALFAALGLGQVRQSTDAKLVIGDLLLPLADLAPAGR